MRNHLFQKQNPQPVLFSVMVFRADFRSSGAQNVSHFFFTCHSKQIQTLGHSDCVEGFDWLSVGAFVYQPVGMLCFVTFSCTEFPYFCTELPHFCIKLTKNCISLSQSDREIFFMYIITILITTTLLSSFLAGHKAY